MSKKARPILGPDGRPLDLTKYAPKPEPATDTKPVVFGTTHVFPVNPWRSLAAHLQGSLDNLTVGTPARQSKSLADRVGDDVAALTAEFEGEGVAELPAPPRDLTAYQDALAAAIESCPHDDIESTIYAKGEYQCQDCGKYLSRADMRKRGPRWFFS